VARVVEFWKPNSPHLAALPRTMLAITSCRAMLWLALVFFFCWSAAASAGDYKVTYAIDVEGRTDAGTIETCVYKDICHITSASLNLTISLGFVYPEYRFVYADVSSRWGCCYFSGGDPSIGLDPTPSVQHIPIFVGRMRAAHEFVQNAKVGVLYLAFSDLQ